MPKTFLLLGTINTFICIALGAFGAHGLKQILTTDKLAVFEIGVQYHLYHALGLLVIGLLLLYFPKSRMIAASGWLMLLGIMLFSGTLYVTSLTEISGMGIVAPFGGISFLSAWALLTYAIWKDK
ncbi:MAG: DUF423 domain-containing protein [Betaproteobacteria bacterium]|nr:DUF423 domain-containing protein [Betaproteobacteria bacterium]